MRSMVWQLVLILRGLLSHKPLHLITNGAGGARAVILSILLLLLGSLENL